MAPWQGLLNAGPDEQCQTIAGAGMKTEVCDLEARWGRRGAMMFAEAYGGPVAVLTAAGGRAVVALQGAQVLSWNADGFGEALWLSPVAKLGTGKAVRGGIPICWPWFGPHPSDAAKPAHGIVRTVPWRVAGSAAAPDRARLVLTFDATAVEPALWPHRARAEIEITLSKALTVSLTTVNLGPLPITLTEALHTYFAVGDVTEVSVSGLAGRRYIDQLAAGHQPIETGAIRFTREVDRIYQETPDDVIVEDTSLARRIRVAKSGSLSTVVWNPGREKAQRLGDMGEDGYRGMVCIETANAGADVVTLAPGARHRLVAEISLARL